MSRKFNFIFSKIVSNEKDITGMIAYSLYKKNKVETIERIKRGKEIIQDSDLEEFNNISNSESQITMYRSQAEKQMAEYSEILLKDKLHEIEKFYRNKSILNFSSGVLQSILGSFIYSFLLLVLILVLWSSEIGFKELVIKILSE